MKLFGFFDSLKNSRDIQSRQKTIRALVFIGIFLLFGSSVFFLNDSSPKEEIGTFNIIKEDKALKARWIGEAAGDLKQQQGSIKNLEKKMQEIQEENKKLQERLAKQEVDLKNNSVKSEIANETIEKDGLYKNFPKPKNNENLDKFLPPALKNSQVMPENKNDTKPTDASVQQIFHKKPIVEHQVYQGSLFVENIVPKKIDENRSKSIEPIDILPTGSILKARLVNGMDAPTMSQAKDNPLITHMIVKDFAILPNRYKYDVRECFVLGEGYGDLSAERVYIRANNLSCVTEDGEHIDFEMKGYVAGEDGKIGLRGEVVSKQGAVLARAIIAGFVDGVGKAFSQAGSTVQVTPYGTTSTNSELSTSELTKKGIYGGLGSGANRLADFYLKLADQVFPVIEIEAGREVNIVVTNKKEMSTLESGQQKTNKDNKK